MIGEKSMSGPQQWPKCDPKIKQYIQGFSELLQRELGPELVGIYLHGSLSMGSFYDPNSDLDLIGVVKAPLIAQNADRLLLKIAELSIGRPFSGDIEFSLITVDTAQNPQESITYELHYSDFWREAILSGRVHYQKEQYDNDLFSHLTYVVQRGICLYGNSISIVFSPVSRALFMDSVFADLADILEEDQLFQKPIYGLLNICRCLQLMTVPAEKNVYSKDEGAAWGLAHLPVYFHSPIRAALERYHGENVIDNVSNSCFSNAYAGELQAIRDYTRAALSAGNQRI